MPKFKHSPNGTGTVTKLSGHRRRPFMAQAPARFDLERQKYVRDTVGYFETEREARDALTLYRRCPPAISPQTTMSELWEAWKPQGYMNISKSTKNGYSAAWAKFSAIHRQKVVDVKTPQLQFCVNETARAGASRSTLHQMKVVAGLLMNYAVQLDLITRNYAEFLQLPKAEQTEKSILSDFNLRDIDALARSGDAVARHVMILCFTGWRIQEYCNLTVFDYDRSAHTLKGGLKTDAGRDRIVPVPERVRGYVEDFFSRSERLCAMNVKQFRAAFYLLLDRLGIQSADGDKKITPHSTRHTYNSMLAKQGVSVEIRMKLMGQVSEDVNRKVYTHTEVEELTRAVSNL
jgi:integrase